MNIFSDAIGPFSHMMQSQIINSMQQAATVAGLGIGGGSGVVADAAAPVANVDPNKGAGDNIGDIKKFEQMLGNLSRDEISLLLQKHVFVTSESPQKTVRSFLALLTVPVVTMFYILIVQHAPLFMKFIITILTVIHVIIITNFLRSHANESRRLSDSDLNRISKIK